MERSPFAELCPQEEQALELKLRTWFIGPVNSLPWNLLSPMPYLPYLPLLPHISGFSRLDRPSEASIRCLFAETLLSAGFWLTSTRPVSERPA